MVALSGGSRAGMIPAGVVAEIATKPKEFQKRIQQYEESRDASAAAAERARLQIEELRGAASKLQEERQRFEKEKEGLQAEIAKAKAEVEQRQVDINNFRAELGRLKAEVESRMEQSQAIESAQGKKAVQLGKLEQKLVQREDALSIRESKLQEREHGLANLAQAMLAYLKET